MTLLLNSCISRPKAENKEISDLIYFPTFPSPTDENGNTIPQYDEENQIVKLPYWYWLQIVDYVTDTETAVTILQSVKE